MRPIDWTYSERVSLLNFEAAGELRLTFSPRRDELACPENQEGLGGSWTPVAARVIDVSPLAPVGFIAKANGAKHGSLLVSLSPARDGAFWVHRRTCHGTTRDSV